MILDGNFLAVAYHLFWQTGPTFAFFHSEGKHPFSKQNLKRFTYGITTYMQHANAHHIMSVRFFWVKIWQNFFNVLFSKCTFREGIDIDTDIDIIIEVNIKSSVVTLTTLKLKNKSFSTNSILYCFYRASFITFFLSRNVSNFLPILLFGRKKILLFYY